MKQAGIFVDTSAWVALLDINDNLHGSAGSCWQSILTAGRRILTSNYVLDETYTLLRRRRNGLKMATLLYDLIHTSDLVDEAEIGSELRNIGWDIFVTYEDKVLSFTDCTSFALMRQRTLLEAFTFDADFQRAGFVALPL